MTAGFSRAGPILKAKAKCQACAASSNVAVTRIKRIWPPALQFGEEFGYENMASGGMGQVQANMSKLPQADIEAIAEYLISLK